MSTDEAEEAPEHDEIADRILRDLESKYADVVCPIHNTPPQFEGQPDGSVVERFCCEALAQIFRELQAGEGAEDA